MGKITKHDLVELIVADTAIEAFDKPVFHRPYNHGFVDTLLGKIGSTEGRMPKNKFTEEFKRNADAQVVDKAYAVKAACTAIFI